MPSFNKYNIDTFVDLNKKKNSGVGLGKGRDVIISAIQEIESQSIYFQGNRKNNPGPGTV